MTWRTPLILLATLVTSIYAVRRLRARGADPAGDSTAPAGTARNASAPETSGSDTRAEVDTVASTVLATLLAWPIVSWTLHSVRGELISGHARPAMIAFYALAGFVPLLVGGGLGWRLGRSRHRRALALWRSTVIGLLIAEALVYLVALAVLILFLYALAHSDWQF